MKILIIDDEDDVRSISHLSLGRVGGMEVLEASNARDGLEIARRENPDVVLLDVMMPEIDGPATLAALRAEPSTSSIPVIFLTAKAMPAEILRLKALGGLEVITKPFNPMKLAEQVRAIYNARHEHS